MIELSASEANKLQQESQGRSLIFLCLAVALINIALMPRFHYRGDALMVQVETVRFINTGSFNLVEQNLEYAGDKGQYFAQNLETKKWYSKYGILNMLMYVPPLVVEKILLGGQLGCAYFTSLRILLLNLYNVLLSVVLAVYLWRLAGLYGRSPAVRFLFVLATFYCTYTWYYLRATGFEIYQLLFFTGFFYHMAAFKNATADQGQAALKPASRNLAAAMGFLACLCLAKTVFLLLVPVAVVFALLAGRGENTGTVEQILSGLRTRAGMFLCWLLAPCIMIVGLVAFVNWLKFGSPLETGYTQWYGDRSLFSGRLSEGINGFLFSMQGGIFIHFPVLVLSFLGVRRFVKSSAWDLALSYSILALFLLVYSKFFDWKGSWGYGPRYLLFILPVASLPFVEVLNKLQTNLSRIMFRLWAGMLTLLLAVSAYVQFQVVRCEFFACEEALGIFNKVQCDKSGQINEYFRGHHYGRICADLVNYQEKKKPWFPLEQLRQSDRPGEVAEIERILRIGAAFESSNFYWFRPPPRPREDLENQERKEP